MEGGGVAFQKVVLLLMDLQGGGGKLKFWFCWAVTHSKSNNKFRPELFSLFDSFWIHTTKQTSKV